MIWTNVFQAVIIMASLIALTVQGTNNAGGFDKVWEIAEEGGRIDFLRYAPSN